MKIFKSYGFWTALAGAVVVLINALGKCFGFAVEEEIVTNIIMAVAGILVVFGVVSMPQKEDTTDQKQENEDDQTDKNQNEELQEKDEETEK